MKKFLIYSVIAVILTACGSGKSLYKKGDYYNATLKAIQTLRKNPNSNRALEIVKTSYPMAIEYNKQVVDVTLQSGSSDKYMTAVDMYTQLNNLADEISRCPVALNAVKPVVYFTSELNSAKELAIKEQYENGTSLLKSGTIDDARRAYVCFSNVKSIKSDYPNIAQLIAVAEDQGTLKVVFEEIPVNSTTYQVSAAIFYNDLLATLKNRTNRLFLRFYKSSEAESLKITPHHLVRVQFNDFSIGNLISSEIVNEYTRDSVIVGSYTDASGKTYDVLGSVKAAVTTQKTELISNGVLSVKIIDYAQNSVITEQKFASEYVWGNSWATFQGDERAVPDDKKRLLDNKQVLPPSAQDLFLLFSSPLLENSASFLNGYYREL